MLLEAHQLRCYWEPSFPVSLPGHQEMIVLLRISRLSFSSQALGNEAGYWIEISDCVSQHKSLPFKWII